MMRNVDPWHVESIFKEETYSLRSPGSVVTVTPKLILILKKRT